METSEGQVFPHEFLVTMRGLVGLHHSIYRRIPPQGIYFEALVEEAFNRIKKPYTVIRPTGRNQPSHDLLVENTRISLKTETGQSTHPERITITKLCTTEREPWSASVLIGRALSHLKRYDVIFMLRAIWEIWPEKPTIIHYQALEIPVKVLRLIRTADLEAVGKRKGRQSLGADVFRGHEKAFHVHFDGSDGKCQVRHLLVKDCVMLQEWDTQVAEDLLTFHRFSKH
jgi:hypothetical protein